MGRDGLEELLVERRGSRRVDGSDRVVGLGEVGGERVDI
jgi:hypothetical protein